MQRILYSLLLCFIYSQSFGTTYVLSLGKIAENRKVGSLLNYKLRENLSKDNPTYIENIDTNAIEDVFIAKTKKIERAFMNVYISTLKTTKDFKAIQLKNENITLDKILEIKNFSSPIVYGSIEESSSKYAMYQNAINANKQDVGQIYEIKIEKIDNNFVYLYLTLREKSYYFDIEENVFSRDIAHIKYVDDIIFTFTYKIKLNKDYLISLEEIRTVRDSVPFFGDIPLIGRLFQAEGVSRQIKDILLINISSK